MLTTFQGVPILKMERHLAILGWQKPGPKESKVGTLVTQGFRESSLEEGVSKPRPERLGRISPAKGHGERRCMRKHKGPEVRLCIIGSEKRKLLGGSAEARDEDKAEPQRLSRFPFSRTSAVPAEIHGHTCVSEAYPGSPLDLRGGARGRQGLTN